MLNKKRIEVLKSFLLRFTKILTLYGLLVVFFWFISSGLLSFSGEVSKNIFKLETAGDKLIVCFLVVAILFTPVYLFSLLKSNKNSVIKPLGTILTIFNLEMSILLTIPVFVLGLQVSANSVHRVISNTELFYYVVLIVMLLGIISTMWLLKDRLKQSNWWVFFIAVPHIMIGWLFQRDYQNFQAFIQSSDFTYEKVADMLEHTKLDLLMINPAWFKCIATVILVFILMIGLILYEFVWEKINRKTR